MEILLTGISHKSGPLELRESLAAVDAPEALKRLKAASWSEAVVVATCNRFEIYAAAENSERLGALLGLMEDWSGRKLGGHCYRKAGADAVRHLFSVAAGLESMVVGEAEILGQVKQAYELARAAGSTGKLTNVLFQRALFVGKLARNETGISTGQLSVASVAVALAERIFGDLRESSVLILGAGQMAELAAKHLLSAKVSKLYVANRTWEKGRDLAAKFRAEAVRWEEFARLLETVDIVIGSTGATEPVVTRQMAVQVFAARRGRSLFLIDIAMPRDVEEAVGDLDHAYLYALSDLEGIVRENLALRQEEIASARALVLRRASDFEEWLIAAAAGRQAGMRHSQRVASTTGSL